MVLVTETEYDSGTAGGDGNVTQVTQHVDATETRVTTYAYDWRNRRTDTDGEIDLYERLTYDNLDRVIRTDRYDTTSTGNLISRRETQYDDRSRISQSVQYAIDPTTGTVGNALIDNTWYDASGNPIKTQPAGFKLFTKMVYDGLGRVTTEYVGFDMDETTYAEAQTITGDTILEQIETTYDDASNAIQTTTRQRYQNATGAGSLNGPSGTQPKARVSYTAHWQDATGREIATADYGTNGGSSLTRPSTIPARSDTVLVTTTEYNGAGEAYKTIDPAGTETRLEFDARNGTVASNDRTTTFNQLNDTNQFPVPSAFG